MTTPATVLRPLGVGERIDAGIKLYVRSFRSLAPALLAIAIPVGVIDGALSAWIATSLASSGPVVVRNFDGSTTVHYAAIGSTVITIVVLWLLWIPGKAVTYKAYGDVYLGRPTTWRGVLVQGLRRVGSLLWIDVLVLGTFLGAAAVSVGVVIAAAPLHALGVLLFMPTILLTAGFFFWWSVSCRAVGPSLMMEDVRGLAAVRRSVSLVRGTWWSVFGTVLLWNLLFVIVSEVVNGIVRVLASIAIPASDVGLHAFVTTLAGQLLAVVVFVPLSCSIATVLTVDMRVRKEGLDLSMLSEGLAAGATAGSYDFLPRPRLQVDPGRPIPPWPPPPPPPPVSGPPGGPWPPAG